MLNPLWLQTFATAATSSSFTEAGRQLGLTQSTVSDHIRRLEASPEAESVDLKFFKFCLAGVDGPQISRQASVASGVPR